MLGIEAVGADVARELNALYGLIEFARARRYPDSLTAHLRDLAKTLQARIEIVPGARAVR
ncbi:MAG: hypothetical protein AB7O21_01180 [Gammaproteobacteria bacterium]